MGCWLTRDIWRGKHTKTKKLREMCEQSRISKLLCNWLYYMYQSHWYTHTHTHTQHTRSSSVKLFSLLLSNCRWLQIISGFWNIFLFEGVVALNQIVPVHYFWCPNTHPKKKTSLFFFSFSLSPRCSGCRAGEPVPLAPALHHLRRLGAGRRPVVHTERHQLAAPPDSLPVQCKSCPPLHPPE